MAVEQLMCVMFMCIYAVNVLIVIQGQVPHVGSGA